MNFRCLFLMLFTCFSVAKAQKIEIFETTLDNGLKIVIVPLKTNEIVRFGLIYNVGCADDPICKIGLSHFLEHMMFQGTKNISGDKFKYLAHKYNAYINAATGEDVTFYYYTVNKRYLSVDLKLEADRMQNLAFNNESIQKEKGVVAEERNMRYDSDQETRHMTDAVLKSLYLHSNYSYTGIGYPHHIAAYNKLSLQKHYNKFYAPNNATVLIVGDISVDEAVEQVKKAFGTIKKTHDISRPRVIDPVDINIKYTLDRTSPKISQKQLDIYYTFDRKHVASLKEFYVAKIMQDCLCGTSRSVMARKFVTDTMKLHDIDGTCLIQAFDKAFFVISATLREDSKMTDIESEIIKSVEDFIAKDFTQELFEVNKQRILNNIDILLDNPGDMFNFIIENRINGYTTDDMRIVKDIVNSITFEEVKKFAKIVLTEANRTHRVYVHPEGSL